MSSSVRLAVVTGANKGIGFEVVKKLAQMEGVRTLLTARNAALGQEAAERVREQTGHTVDFHQLDIDDSASIATFAEYIKGRGGVDILINNAGIAFKGDAFNKHVAETTLKTNFFSLMHVTDALLPLVRENGRVVVVASMTGHLRIVQPQLREKFASDSLTRDELVGLMNKFVDDVEKGVHKEEGWPHTTYGVSKLGAIALTKVFARQTEGKRPGVLVNCVCPGWCRTDMAGDKATLSAEQGADNVLPAALLPPGSAVNGQFFENAQPSVW